MTIQPQLTHDEAQDIIRGLTTSMLTAIRANTLSQKLHAAIMAAERKEKERESNSETTGDTAGND